MLLRALLVALTIIFIQFEYCHANSMSDSIISVAMLTRHGDRAPSGTYPNDPYAYYSWPYGMGELTPKGIRQLFKSGMNKADRYKKLLSGLFDNSNYFGPKQIYVRSSSYGRCVESAKSFLDGFVPILSEHVPIEVSTDEDDTMLTYAGKPCTKFEAEFEYDLRFDQPAVEAIVGDTHVIDYIANHSGMNPVNTLLDIWRPCDVLHVNQDNGWPLPAWAVPIFHKYVHPLLDLILERIASTKKLQIKSGVLLNDIISRWDRYMNGKPERDIQNILLYSSHEMYLQALLQLLEVHDQVYWRPDYAAVISLELHYNVNVNSGVEIRAFFFRDEEDVDPIQMRIPACAAPCEYKKFKRLMAIKLVPDSEYNQICEN